MRFRQKVFLGSLVAAAVITGTGVYFLSQAAAETERTRQIAEADTDCANKVPAAIAWVVRRNSLQGARVQVTGSASHFNRRLSRCLVEVSTFEHQYGPAYVKTLMDMGRQSQLLGSLAGDSVGSVRNCFGADDSKPFDCREADRRWKTLMNE